MRQLARRPLRRAGEMKYAVRRGFDKNAFKRRGLPRAVLDDDMTGLARRTAPERADLDAVPMKHLDKMSSDEPMCPGDQRTMHEQGMPPAPARTSAGRARSR